MEITDMVLVPVIVGLVDALKGYGLQKKWCPVVSIVLGVASGVVYVFPEDWASGVLSGIVMGLSAGGLYSGGKAVVGSKPIRDTL
ncbi:hypothetical protein CSV69_04485 [Sporosarcina sp. P26b]|uniref:hypothetical protein n=1 Tax=Sporosarcina TaxID=1569 RepID=UPI000A17B8D1|nr:MULTISPECIES: hypothetical protein [Sporosarcina]ARK20342.1 hypothetical protein SporoP32a_01530 [Sporosarcina ureae]PIC96782.1 hypothetical protein CSV69_04485 [Sporosarcina sp. P26b]